MHNNQLRFDILLKLQLQCNYGSHTVVYVVWYDGAVCPSTHVPSQDE